MTTIIHDTIVEERLRAERIASGGDRYDEVWENVYMMAPMPNHEHQLLVGRFTRVLDEVVTDAELGEVVPGVNVSDRVAGWETNYRVPDVAVFLKTTRAVNHDQFWCGGPDLVIEIVSPHDQTREKLRFYEAIATGELLVVDRAPWQLELYRHDGQALRLVTTCRVDDGRWLESHVLGLQVCLQAGSDRPRMHVCHPASARNWRI